MIKKLVIREESESPAQAIHNIVIKMDRIKRKLEEGFVAGGNWELKTIRGEIKWK